MAQPGCHFGICNCVGHIDFWGPTDWKDGLLPCHRLRSVSSPELILRLEHCRSPGRHYYEFASIHFQVVYFLEVPELQSASQQPALAVSHVSHNPAQLATLSAVFAKCRISWQQLILAFTHISLVCNRFHCIRSNRLCLWLVQLFSLMLFLMPILRFWLFRLARYAWMYIDFENPNSPKNTHYLHQD